MDHEFQLLPEQASTLADEVDRLYAFLWAVSGVMTVLIGALILYFAIKYRRGSRADRTPAHGHFLILEATWIVVPFVVTMVMFFWGAGLYFKQTRVPAGAMEITGVGKQWMWKFQHPSGCSEINDLHVPLGQPIQVRLISEDVIHSLYVPAFRVKQDVLPGRYTTLWFTPTRVGKYHLFCAEYCGADHSKMRGTVFVLEPAEYERWLDGKSGSAGGQTAGAQSLLEQFRCLSCHQGKAVAGRGPPLEGLFGSTVPLKDGGSVVADENYIRESIVRPQAKIVAGYQSIMPSFEGQIGEEGLNRLIAEIKALGAARPSAGSDGEKTGPEQLDPDAANGAANGVDNGVDNGAANGAANGADNRAATNAGNSPQDSNDQ
jgi:cytochrome c oxidase subunit 2